MHVLSDIVWAFKRKVYNSEEEFDQAIAAYQSAILKEKAHWEAGRIAIPVSEIDVCYEAWIKNKEALKPNETLLDDTDAFDEANGENGFYQVELCARLKAVNGAHFTVLDLMYQLQRQVGNKELGDHVFFEGLTPGGDRASGNEVPLYYLDCGS
ncbi:hypothetical protein [Taibaiella koreensis]|uniref:hypothetical protein n=1 Tax=Taibaiella koreensis TaxID=1268548 RepID=UPI0013C3223A|nr:hypothetical protein [Taibaiella koreensis]